MSFFDFLFGNAESMKPPTKVPTKSDPESSNFTKRIEIHGDSDLKFGLIKWEEYKLEEYKRNNKKPNKITAIEGDTINYTGNLYRLLTGFYFHHKKVPLEPHKFHISLNVCVTDLQTNRDKVLEWKLPISTDNISRNSKPKLDITLDKYLGLENVFDSVTGEERILDTDSIKSGLRLGEDFRGMKVIYRDVREFDYKGIERGTIQEIWGIPTKEDLPRNGIIFFDTVLQARKRGGFILNKEKRAEYDRLNNFDGYLEPEESELSIWYDSEYD